MDLTVLAGNYNQPGHSLVIILSPKRLTSSELVLVYKRQHMITEANSIHKWKTVAQNHPVFLHYRLDFSGAPHSYLRNNDRERETATSQNHKKNTCPFLTLIRFVDYKDTVNDVILTQQWEGERKRAHRCQVRVQGFPAGPRPTCPGWLVMLAVGAAARAAGGFGND